MRATPVDTSWKTPGLTSVDAREADGSARTALTTMQAANTATDRRELEIGNPSLVTGQPSLCLIINVIAEKAIRCS